MDPMQTSPTTRDRERRRIVAGLLAALAERDPRALRERDVIAAAAVTPSAFHAHFDDLDACFDFACEAALDTLLTPLTASWSVPRPPREQLAAALDALLGALAAQPRLAELCLLHSTARQPDRRTHRRAVAAVAGLLRELSAPEGSVSAAGGTTLARGVVALIAARLAERGGAGLEQLQPQLLALLSPPLGLGGADALVRSNGSGSASNRY